jgi:hypothetical protein
MSETHEEQVERILAEREQPAKKQRKPIGKGSPPVACQFKPGVSGNPKGKPAGTVSLLAHLKNTLAEVPPGEKRNRAQMLAEQTWRDAMRGDGAARKLCWEYIEGAATQQINVAVTLNDIPDEDLDAEFERVNAAIKAEEARARPRKAPAHKAVAKVRKT